MQLSLLNEEKILVSFLPECTCPTTHYTTSKQANAVFNIYLGVSTTQASSTMPTYNSKVSPFVLVIQIVSYYTFTLLLARLSLLGSHRCLAMQLGFSFCITCSSHLCSMFPPCFSPIDHGTVQIDLIGSPRERNPGFDPIFQCILIPHRLIQLGGPTLSVMKIAIKSQSVSQLPLHLQPLNHLQNNNQKLDCHL